MLTSIPSLLSKGKYKPRGIPKINWADPRTIGLVKAYLVNGYQSVDLINGIAPTMTGTVIPKATHGGQAAYFGANNSHALTNYYVVNTVKQLGGNASFSVVAGIVNTLNTSTIGDSFTVYGERAASGNDILKLGFAQGTNGTSPVILTYRNDAGTLIQTGTASGINTNDGRFHVIAGTKFGSGSNNSTVYLDGRAVGTASWNTNDNFTDANIKCFIGGDIADPVSGFPGSVHFVYLYKRSLNQAQINALTADPYGFLIFPQDYVTASLRGLFPVFGTITGYQQPDYGAASLNEVVPISIAAMQAPDYGAATLAETLTAAITAFQESDYGAASASETISASGAAEQAPDYGAASTDEIIASTIAAYQASDYGTVTIAEVIAATIAAAQEPDFGAMTAAQAVAAAVVAYQGPDYGAITDSEIISAVIAAYQGADYGALSGSEIISVLVDAQQQMDYADMIFPVVLGFVTLTSSLKWRATPTDAAVNSAALSNARLYTATATDAV